MYTLYMSKEPSIVFAAHVCGFMLALQTFANLFVLTQHIVNSVSGAEAEVAQSVGASVQRDHAAQGCVGSNPDKTNTL